MQDGFIKVAAATPEIRVADCNWNRDQIIHYIQEAEKQGVKVLLFPELSLTGCTCGDLFFQHTLLEGALTALAEVTEATRELDVLVFVGLPFTVKQAVYNVAAVLRGGELLGLIPKRVTENSTGLSDSRYFKNGPQEPVELFLEDQVVLFGENLLISEETLGMTIGTEFGSEIYRAAPKSNDHALAGANVIVNLAGEPELAGTAEKRGTLVVSQAERLHTAYLYAGAGEGESTTDHVFSGHAMIAEQNTILAETRFQTGLLVTEIDIEKLNSEGRKCRAASGTLPEGYAEVSFFYGSRETVNLTRSINRLPFVPEEETKRNRRAEEILTLQALGLKKRLQHTNCKAAVIGISGGLDSTLALLVTCRAFDLLGLSREGILAVTMPCFGTTDRTYNNALMLAKELGATVKEVPLADSVRKHFEDIGHDEVKKDVTYENSQARERTQVLMDLANEVNGMVIGTGDLSELVLGWATYNGDHMSMYGVNAGVPKTLVRVLTEYVAKKEGKEALKTVLFDILSTPVSPELLPPSEGEISQKTEDLVGPYELHDFFLYYALRFGFSPAKIFRMAVYAFAGEYDKKVIMKWLKSFYRRFFSQQFKRSCLPDGPRVGSVGVSPRGTLLLPSDACARLWLDKVEELEKTVDETEK